MLHFIATGGTIDSSWNIRQDTATVNEHSIIPEYLKQLELKIDYVFSEVCMKDSRALTAEDLNEILRVIEESESEKIIITHGTYTMPDTAKFLEDNLKKKVTIILTGSVTPLRGFDFSDASFNLGYAVAKVEELSVGIYLCMDGKVFTKDEIFNNSLNKSEDAIFKDKQ